MQAHMLGELARSNLAPHLVDIAWRFRSDVDVHSLSDGSVISFV